MSDNQRTPGPWTAEQRGDWAYLSAPDWLNFASVVVRVDARADPQGEAHLRLFLAAPDLLALARRNLDAWENAIELGIIPERHRNTAEVLAQESRAAIAKATGKDA